MLFGDYRITKKSKNGIKFKFLQQITSEMQGCANASAIEQNQKKCISPWYVKANIGACHAFISNSVVTK
jgi:hypothetical protein